ncbi:MAG: GNAT family N-acetyltransferase [Bacteroidales bacterium]|nr:GNAT family N-acetyltransferase [Bacteroidales bacterium]
MIEIVTLETTHIDLICNSLWRNQLTYNEYSFISDNQLKEYLRNNLIKSLSSDDFYSFAAITDGTLSGVISCNKNDFDSDNFKFNCYRITELLILSENYVEVSLIVKKLTYALEQKLASISRPFYLAYSLNNNTSNSALLFNSLTSNKYHYIHTLLTFSSQKKKFESLDYYPNEKLTIRKVRMHDAKIISELAQKSFKYSRFHLDPFLDNFQASLLLKKSAENSILKGYVDIMFVAEINNTIIGYYSGKKRYIPELNKTIGEAVISAVDSDSRGLGVFSKMDNHLLNWFADNTDFAEMGTYLVNFPVHKTWINKGLGLIKGMHQFSKFVNK